jgi:predicted Zn-dependent protease
MKLEKILDIGQKIALRKGLSPQDFKFSARIVQENTWVRSVRNEAIDENSYDSDSGLHIEVWYKGHFAHSGTANLSENGAQKAFETALSLAEAAHNLPLTKFEFEKVRPSSKGHYSSTIKRPLNEISSKEVFDQLLAASNFLKVSPQIQSRTAYSMTIKTDFDQISSEGARFSHDFSIVNTDFNVVACEGTETQTRSDKGGLARCAQIGAEAFSLTDLNLRCQKIGEEAIELLKAPECPTGNFDLILAPDQMILQIHESIGHPLELDRILGDERNYAGWSFVQPSDFGKLQYGSSMMNVTFDPTPIHELASYGFDDYGNPATKEFLIKDGQLLRGLGSLESQQRLGIPGVANARSASWNRAPIDRMANINLEPGASTLEQMIGSIAKGALFYSNKSWSIDDYRDKFQFGCEMGLWIENGQVKHKIKNPNYRGQTLSFWRNLKAVGDRNQVEFLGSPYCGKGEPNQVIRVGHSSPYCLFKDISIFGGGR